MQRASYKVQDLATRVNGQVFGDGTVPVSGLSSIDEPVAGSIGFLNNLEPEQDLEAIAKLGLVALLVSSRRPDLIPSNPALPLICVASPIAAIIKLVPLFYDRTRPLSKISELAAIHPTAKLGKNISVGAFCSIGENVEIGDETVLYPNVTIYSGVKIGAGSTIHAGAVIRENCKLGKSTVIQNGAIIGADGFGYIADPQVGLIPVPQVGVVNLSDNVEIGANTCVDRATLGSTRIGFGTKIDNLVQIGHNVSIGSHSIVCGMSGIAGSSKIGNQVVIASKVGISDHITIVDGVRTSARSTITADILEKGDYFGTPLNPLKPFAGKKLQLALLDLPRLLKKLRKLAD